LCKVLSLIRDASRVARRKLVIKELIVATLRASCGFLNIYEIMVLNNVFHNLYDLDDRNMNVMFCVYFAVFNLLIIISVYYYINRISYLLLKIINYYIDKL